MTPADSPTAHHEDVPGFDDLDRAWLRERPGVKWRRPPGDVLPAWIADMDYPLPPVVADAIRRAVDFGDVGYPRWLHDGSPLREAFADRMSTLYGWDADPERVREQSDLIQSLQLVLHLATSPGDPIAVLTPNYPPFLATLEAMGRRSVTAPMVDTDHGWQMDMAALADGVARSGAKVLLLVNPHNPTGRVLTREELQEIAAIATRHDLLVITDEIHAELVHAPHAHIPFASLSTDAAARTVTLNSASKAFNLAGLRCCVTHYGPDRLLAIRDAQPSELYGTVSNLSVTGTLAAWREGTGWQKNLLAVLDRNRRRVADVVAERLPRLRHHMPEGTYLAWFDARALARDGEPVQHVLRHGNVLLDGGRPFGPDAEQYLRLNFATSRSVLEEALDGLVRALEPQNGHGA